MKHCAPHKKNDGYTCFTKESLIQLSKAVGIKYSNKNKKELHEELKNNFKTSCKSEYCWLDRIKLTDDEILNREIKYYTFKPKIPKGRYELLNTDDINHVLIQYEIPYDDFIYMGTLPSDAFRCKDRYEKLRIALNNYNYVGIVFNLDEHDKPGSHWVSVFINNKNKTIEYFDSLGHMPINNIMKVFNKIKGYRLIINGITHQTGRTTCGLYSILFIIYKLYNPNDFNYLKNRVEDKKVNPLRQKFFRPLE